MNRTALTFLVLAAGVAQPLQGIVNAHIAQRVTALWAAAISGCVTAVTLSLVAVLVFHVPPPSPKLIASMPFFAVAGGLLGAFLLASITTATPRLGATVTYLCFIAGITVCSVLLDYFGVLGLPQQDISLSRLLGIAMIVGGVVIIHAL